MNIQLQNQAYFPHLGGIQWILAQMAKELAQRGHRPSILCRADDDGPGASAWDGVPVLRHPYQRPSGLWWVLSPLLSLRALRREIGRCLDGAELLWPVHEEYALASAEAAARIPTIYVVQHNSSRMIRMNWRPAGLRSRLGKALVVRQCALIQRKALHRAAAVVTWSEMTKRDMVTSFGVDPAKVHVVRPGPGFLPNGSGEAGADGLGDRLGLPPRARVVLCVCRLVPNKNVGLLIRALAHVRDPRAHVVVVGDGPERPRLERLSRDHGVADRVRFAGAHYDVRPFYTLADVFAFPSLFEGFGIVLLEAMAKGIPCIALRADYPRVLTSSDEIIEDGRTGFTVSPYSDTELAERIDALLGDPELARRMGRRGRERFETLFTWRRHIDALLTLSGTRGGGGRGHR